MRETDETFKAAEEVLLCLLILINHLNISQSFRKDYLVEKSCTLGDFLADILGEDALDQNGQSLGFGFNTQFLCLLVNLDILGDFSVLLLLILNPGPELIIRTISTVSEWDFLFFIILTSRSKSDFTHGILESFLPSEDSSRGSIDSPLVFSQFCFGFSK